MAKGDKKRQKLLFTRDSGWVYHNPGSFPISHPLGPPRRATRRAAPFYEKIPACPPHFKSTLGKPEHGGQQACLRAQVNGSQWREWPIAQEDETSFSRTPENRKTAPHFISLLVYTAKKAEADCLRLKIYLRLRPPPRLPSILRFKSAILPSEEDRNCLSLSSKD